MTKTRHTVVYKLKALMEDAREEARDASWHTPTYGLMGPYGESARRQWLLTRNPVEKHMVETLWKLRYQGYTNALKNIFLALGSVNEY